MSAMRGAWAAGSAGSARAAAMALATLAGAVGPASAGTDLYVVGRIDAAFPGQGQVMAVDVQTGSVTPILSGGFSGATGGLALDGDTLYVGATGLIWRLDLDAGALAGSIVATGVPGATHNALAVVGDTLYSVKDGDFQAQLIRLEKSLDVQAGEVVPVFTDVKTMAVESGGLFVGGHSSIAQRGSLGGTGFSFFAACGGRVNSMAFSASTLFLGGMHFGSNDALIYTFDKHVGGVSYTSTFDAGSDARAMVYQDSVLYVAGTDGLIRALDPANGAEVAPAIDTGMTLLGMISAGPGLCAADFSTDGHLDSGDLALFVVMFIDQDLGADLTGDGAVDSGDLSMFVELFIAGC